MKHSQNIMGRALPRINDNTNSAGRRELAGREGRDRGFGGRQAGQQVLAVERAEAG
jgi:hypothetical protein